MRISPRRFFHKIPSIVAFRTPVFGLLDARTAPSHIYVSGPPTATLPLVRDDAGRLFCDILVDNQPARALIDTASPSMVDRRHTKAGARDGGDTPVHSGTHDLSLGPILLCDIQLLAMDFARLSAPAPETTPDFTAVLGCDVLNAAQAAISFSSLTLKIRRPG